MNRVMIYKKLAIILTSLSHMMKLARTKSKTLRNIFKTNSKEF